MQSRVQSSARVVRSRAGFAQLESLEPRLAMSITAVGIGGVFSDDGVIPYVLDGSIDDHGGLRAQSIAAGIGGGAPARSYPVDDLGLDDHGGLRPGFEDSFKPYDHSNGAAFLRRYGNSGGWYQGRDDSYARAEFSFLMEPAQGATLADSEGSWGLSFLHTEWEDGRHEVDVRWGSAVISGSAITWTINRVGREARADTDSITSVTPGGKLLISHEGHESVQLGAGKQLALYIDLDRADNEVSTGLLYRIAPDKTMPQIAGTYRVGMVATGALARSVSAEDAALLNFVLALDADGTYQQYDTADYDAGGRTATAAGTWMHDAGTVILSQAGRGATWNFAVGGDSQLIPRFYLTTGAADQPVVGLAARAESATTPVFTVAQSATGGNAVIYELHDDRTWRRVDVAARSGGPALRSEPITWEDRKDGLQYAAGISVNGGLVLFRRAASGLWSHRILSDDLAAAKIATDLNIMVGADGLAHLSGLDSARDLVEYAQSGRSGLGGEFEWEFHHRGDELRTAGLPMPAFAGPLISYATRWNGLNIAGLSDDGHIWSVWWAPGMTGWRSDDLTVGLGGGKLSGGLTVYQTSWDGINLAGIDDSGHVAVTWWVPGFGGRWEQSDLTAMFAGPGLAAAAVSSYVSSWDGLNIAGFDKDSGELKVYWWSPAVSGEGWKVTSLAAAIPAGSPMPAARLRGLAADDSSLNLMGESEAGAMVRLHWEPGMGGTWAATNITASAIDA
ncbi:MAG: hypothetical protein IT436_12335 [Phycisphaerales bacterium]|nr:hypothetical protein [Phycisphaerales bacterium]